MYEHRIAVVTVLAPVPDADVVNVRRDLDRLRDDDSVFANVPGTHFARLAVISRETAFRVRPSRHAIHHRPWRRLLTGRTVQAPDYPATSYLLFSATYDQVTAGHHDYWERLRTGLGPTADRIWNSCSGYPGYSDRTGFASFLSERTIKPRYEYSAFDSDPSVEEVHEALRVRHQIVQLAVETTAMSDAELASRLRSEFERPADRLGELIDSDLADLTPNDLALPPYSAAMRISPDRASVLYTYLGPRSLEQPSEMSVPTLGDSQHGNLAPDLADVQNLVVTGYARHQAARHLLLQVNDQKAAREWLASVIGEIPTAGWAESVPRATIGWAVSATSKAPHMRPSLPTLAVHIAFSHHGLAQIGVPEAHLRAFPQEFKAGMAAREPGLIPDVGTSTWTAPFGADPGVDILLMSSSIDNESLDQELRSRPSLIPEESSGITVLGTCTGQRLNNAATGSSEPETVEHFGYRVGLSQPRIHGLSLGSQTAELPPGEVLLGYQDVDGDTAGSGLPAELAHNGSYLVYRRLEQDVEAFQNLTRRLGAILADDATEVDLQELAAAKLMGRWPDGTPTTLSPGGARPALIDRPFGFWPADADGFACPVGAHIRRANPREDRPLDREIPDEEPVSPSSDAMLALRHRMLRRAISYGPPVGDGAGDIAKRSGESRGLLFIALVADIHRQFEFVQAHQMSDGNAMRLGQATDLFSGTHSSGNAFVVQGRRPKWIRPDANQPLVTCRGGEYFLLPGIRALRRLAHG